MFPSKIGGTLLNDNQPKQHNMKSTLRLTVAIVLTYVMLPSTLFAQASFNDIKYPYANDSLINEIYENAAWKIENTQKYYLYPDRRPMSVNMYDPSAGFPYKIDYLYDGSNRLTGYNLSLKFGTWMEFIHLRITRDNNGNVTEVFVEQLDQPGGSFVNDSKTTITYDSQNRAILQIEQNWDDNLSPAAWVIDSKSTYTYNANNKLDVQLDSSYVSSNAYIFNAKYVHEYANGLLTLKYRKTALDAIAARTTYSYNSANVLWQETTENYDGSTYTLYEKDSSVLDASNLITQTYRYKFDFSLNKSILSERLNATGSAVGISNTNYILKAIKAFPNPTSGITYIKLSKPMDAYVSVYNSLGELVMSLSLKAGESGIDLSSLNNGIYVLSVKSQGETYQSKIILNK